MARKFLTGIDVASQRVQHVADPTASDDAASKAYVDGLVNGLRFKVSVKAASTANVSVSSAPSTLDGITLSSGDRVLLKDQTAGAENGIYIFTAAAAALTRALDADSATELTAATVVVEQGTVNADKQYTQTVDGITVGTTALVWALSSPSAYTAASNAGLSLSGGAFSVVAGTGVSVGAGGVAVDTSVVTRKYAVNVPNGSTTATITHSLGTLDVVVAVYEISTGVEVEADVTLTSTNALTLGFATAPTSGQYRCVVHG